MQILATYAIDLVKFSFQMRPFYDAVLRQHIRCTQTSVSIQSGLPSAEATRYLAHDHLALRGTEQQARFQSSSKEQSPFAGTVSGLTNRSRVSSHPCNSATVNPP